MKTIDYKLIDELSQRIESCERHTEYYAEHRMYELAAQSTRDKRTIQGMLDLIVDKFVKEIPDEADTDDEYIYLNKDNWMQYWGKEIQVSDAEDFSKYASKGRFAGYTPECVYVYQIAGDNRYKYARVRREK